jgi:hypothetical protein
MADFRKWIYALALVALLAGFTVPASAQNAPLECIANAGVPPTVRYEGFTELVGDLTLNCTGGTPTPAGQVVQPVNISVSINTNLTSRLLSGTLATTAWSEALLIIDEPHSAVQVARPILNCGNAGALDNGPSGANVCAIYATADPSKTYDGQQNGYGGVCTGGTPLPGFTCASTGGVFTTALCTGTASPAAGTYGCGRPNVFQGRFGFGNNLNNGAVNSVSWLGVPLDPPGTTTSRTLRITNIRANAHGLGINSSFFQSYVQASISINGNTSLSVNNPTQIVAYVSAGLNLNNVKTVNNSFLQCVGEPKAPTGPGFVLASGSSTQNNGAVPAYTFSEGFGSSWKAKNISFILNSSTLGYTGNGFVPSGVAASYWEYDGFNSGAPGGTINYPKDFNQNVPGAIYNTESGFMWPGASATLDSGAIDPTPGGNPPFGVGTTQVATTNTLYALHNGTAIDNAGIADAGTRLIVQIQNVPLGAAVYVPAAIYLTNGTVTGSGTSATPNFSGVAVLLTNSTTDGSGAYAPAIGSSITSAATAVSTYLPLASSGYAIYEILFADPFSIETMTVNTLVVYSPALNLTQPVVNQTATAIGGFAPFETSAAASQPSAGPVPRFAPSTPIGSPNLFSINLCACNLLFPFVATSGGYDTGIAIANTSMDNLGTAFTTSLATNQAGGVEFWYYGAQNGGQAPPTQCTNVATPGKCPTPPFSPSTGLVGQIPAGGSLIYSMALAAGTIIAPGGVSSSPGLLPVNGFEGYVIAQAGFQYCHAFAFIGAFGQGPISTGISEGYVALLLDNGGFVSNSTGIVRTNQRGESLAH